MYTTRTYLVNQHGIVMKTDKLIEDMDLRFMSGNSVPVKTVQIPKELWDEVRQKLLDGEAAKKELSDIRWTGVK